MSIKQLTNLSKNLRITSIVFIISISLSLFLLGCGSGIEPQMKVQNAETGQFGLDLTLTPPDTGSFNKFSYVSLAKQSIPSILNQELTVEAWVMVPQAGLREGTIYYRGGDFYGIWLYVDTTVPQFALRTGGTPFILFPGYDDALAPEKWTHIAGVLSSGHSAADHQTATCSIAERSDWHLDLHINGQFVDCNVAAAPFECIYQPGSPGDANCPADRATGDLTHARIGSKLVSSWPGVGPPAKMNNIKIDEIRVWSVARTGTEINQCMNTELSLGGICSIDPNILKGYWKFNTGSGIDVADHSGRGNTGRIEYCDNDCFGPGATFFSWNNDNIWESGYPFP